MKLVSSITTFNDAVGTRMSVTYSEIDEQTGRIISDNKRADRIVLDPAVRATIDEMVQHAQDFIDSLDP